MIQFVCFALFLLNGQVLISTAMDLPKSELEHYENVAYLTYTRKNQHKPVDIRHADFDDTHTTVFIIHGVEVSMIGEPLLKVKDDIFAYRLDVERVVVVSWIEFSFASGITTQCQSTSVLIVFSFLHSLSVK